MTIQTSDQVKGRAIGAMFFACFGTCWLLLALALKEALHAASVLGTLAGLAALLAAAVVLMSRARALPAAAVDPRAERAKGRAFIVVNAVQWTAISAVAFSFAKLRIDAYVFCAIAAIVGLHLFPLARLFAYPLHYATGSALVLWAATAGLSTPAAEMQGTTAMGTGAILWLSAAVTLGLSLRAARRPAPTGRGVVSAGV